MESIEVKADRRTESVRDALDILKQHQHGTLRPKDRQTLRRAFNEVPELATLIGDLSRIALVHVVENISANDVTADAMIAHIDQVKRDLGYATAPELERLLIEHVALCWAQVHAVIIQQQANLRSDTDFESRLDAAQKRYLRASETLAKVRRLARRAPSLQVNIAEQQIVA